MFDKNKSTPPKPCCCTRGHEVGYWQVTDIQALTTRVVSHYDPAYYLSRLGHFSEPSAEVEGTCGRCNAVIRGYKPYGEVPGQVIAELCKRLRDAKKSTEDKSCPQK